MSLLVDSDAILTFNLIVCSFNVLKYPNLVDHLGPRFALNLFKIQENTILMATGWLCSAPNATLAKPP